MSQAYDGSYFHDSDWYSFDGVYKLDKYGNRIIPHEYIPNHLGSGYFSGVKEKDGLYYDSDDNTWNIKNYTKEEAEELSKGMIDSHRCHDCENCRGCKDCQNGKNCRNCEDCQDSSDCHGCNGCFMCKNSITCKGCSGCDNCDSCSFCSNCYNCQDLYNRHGCVNNLRQ